MIYPDLAITPIGLIVCSGHEPHLRCQARPAGASIFTFFLLISSRLIRSSTNQHQSGWHTQGCPKIHPKYGVLWLFEQARKPRSYASPKLRPTHSLTYLLTGVKCRATSVAKKSPFNTERRWRKQYLCERAFGWGQNWIVQMKEVNCVAPPWGTASLRSSCLGKSTGKY